MRIEVVGPADLSDSDVAAWRAYQALGGFEQASPFLSPDWAMAAGRALAGERAPVRIAVVREGQEPRGFFAARVGKLTALPVGAPLSDHQGFVGQRGLVVHPHVLLEALGVKRYDFCHMGGTDRVFAPYAAGGEISYVVDVSDGWEAYARGRRAAGTDVLKDVAKKRRRLERDVGQVEFTPMSRSLEDFDQVMAWTRERHRRTRQTDVVGKPWVGRLLEEMFETDRHDFGGALFTLRVGGRLAAAQFNLRGERCIHAWFIGQDTAFDRYSPGLVMFGEVLAWMAESPWRELTLGPVAYRFKDRLANRVRRLAYGSVGRPSMAAFVRTAEHGVRRLAEGLPLGPVSHWPGKAMRRIDRWRALA
jgi:CelD/BcsL family acetyltransferase involved in cellulose biosynthesis